MSSAMSSRLSFLCIFLLLAAHGFGQTSPSTVKESGSDAHPSEQTDATPVFHAETRLVVVDVVVTDGHGHPVTGLAKSDFTLLENGKPQTLQIVEQHLPLPAQPAPPQVQLPPNEYSNYPAQQHDSSINVILMDFLNTTLTDQMFARWELIEFLKRMPSGRQVALFTLDRQLRMISDFTTNSQDLAAAAAKLRLSPSQLLDEDRVMAQLSPDAPAGSISSPLSGFISALPDTAGSLQRLVYGESVAQTSERVGWTIQAFDQIARALSGYPGRKNLIWLSEGFPITLSPSFLSQSTIVTMRDYSSILRESSVLLSSAQISVYPIDVHGLAGNVGNPELFRLQSDYDTENDIAKQTGGEAFYSSNDLKWAMEQSMERGSTYYTVAYVPENKKWDSKYRHIKIKLGRPGLEAKYRPGYFATPTQQITPEDAHNDLISTMQPGIPESTMLLLRARVLPPKDIDDKVSIDCTLFAPDILFTEGANRLKHARLEFVAVAWDKKKSAAGYTSKILDLTLGRKKYEAAMKTGISFHYDLEVKPGDYTLRVGVTDEGSGKIGTLSVPLSVGGNPKPGVN
jgi:VWFA-related protein